MISNKVSPSGSSLIGSRTRPAGSSLLPRPRKTGGGGASRGFPDPAVAAGLDDSWRGRDGVGGPTQVPCAAQRGQTLDGGKVFTSLTHPGGCIYSSLFHVCIEEEANQYHIASSPCLALIDLCPNRRRLVWRWWWNSPQTRLQLRLSLLLISPSICRRRASSSSKYRRNRRGALLDDHDDDNVVSQQLEIASNKFFFFFHGRWRSWTTFCAVRADQFFFLIALWILNSSLSNSLYLLTPLNVSLVG